MKKETVTKQDTQTEYLKSNSLKISQISSCQEDGIVLCFYGMLEQTKQFNQHLDRVFLVIQ